MSFPCRPRIKNRVFLLNAPDLLVDDEENPDQVWTLPAM